MSIQFEYYSSRESEQFTFYRIPKALFTDPAFFSLSTDAKLLYGLMLDRIGLSVRSGWVDEQDHVYIYFTQGEIMDQLHCGHNKAIRLLKELDQDIGLIRRRRQGLGKPDRIYVMNFTTGTDNQLSENRTSDDPDTDDKHHSCIPKEEMQNSHNGTSGLQMSENGTSGYPVCGVPEVPKEERIKNDINNIYMSDTDLIYPSRQEVQEQEPQMDGTDGFNSEFYQQVLRGRWGYLSLLDNHSREEVNGLITLGADVLASKQETIRIGGQDLPKGDVATRLYSLDFTHIDYVLECMHRNTTPVRNMRSYLLTALYNAPATIDSYYANQVALHGKSVSC